MRGPVAIAMRRTLPYSLAILVTAASTVVCATMLGRFDNSNLVMVYLLGVAFVASTRGRGPSALAAVLGVAAFDFFFVPPHLTFVVADSQYLLTFAVMLLVSLLISTLSGRVRAQAEDARGRERRTRILYAISRDLAVARTTDEVVDATTRHVSEVVQGPAEVLPSRPAVDALPTVSATRVPLEGSRGTLAVLSVRPHEKLMPLAPDSLDLLQALARQSGSALERVRLAADAEETRVAVETERLRNTLLSSVSHDLRTPLAAITGAASSLLEPLDLDPATERSLKQAIYDEADRLGRLVANLLDMTSLESGGALHLNRDWHVLEELVGSALARLGRVRAGRSVVVEIPPDLPLVSVDAVLLEQVFLNLLENAFKYTPPDVAVRVRARPADATVRIEVADEGPGIPADKAEKVFEKFYRQPGAGERGFGLGLPICRAIVEAHGGRIWVEPREPHGSALCFTLPAEETAPPLEDADDAA